MKLVSIIMPVYNSEKTLKKSIESILCQTYTNFELIIVNDGSTDTSAEICEEFSKRDSRIKVINKENEGAGPARNMGLDIAVGEYVMFPDSDDWMEDTMVEELVQCVEGNKVQFAICKCNDIITKKGNKITKLNSNLPEKILRTKREVREQYIEILDGGIACGPSDKIYKLSLINEKE